MVDDGRRLYTKRNATDAQTGRTIITPVYTRGPARPPRRPVATALVYLVIGIMLAGAGIAAFRFWPTLSSLLS